MRGGFLVFAALVLACASAMPSYCQNTQYGKNKVQYKDFNWKYIQSPHFDIYFYDGGREIAEFCAEIAEPALASIQRTVHFDITERISILVYNSHNDFQQTNAVGEYLPEGVGGVTELMKNRVVLPYEGDYSKFRHVIHHELVHAVLNEMFSGGSYQALLTGGGMQIPTWMNEGLAEYESLGGLDVETDMFMRDATLSEQVPPLERLGGYVQYRVGQTMYTYIADKYGPEKVGELLNRMRTTRSAEMGFRSTFGLGISEFSEHFLEYLKKHYYPDISRFEEPSSFAEIIADHQKIGNFFNSSPEISPNGEYLAFISDRNDEYEVWVQNLNKPKDVHRVLGGGGSTAQFEELHLLAPGLTWSNDGKRLAVVSKAGKSDAISIITMESGDIDRLPVPNLDGIFQVKLSPDGKWAAFIGYKDGASDIFLYDLVTKEFRNITRDVFSDQDIYWSPDSKSIVFSSDRKDHIIPGEYPVDGIEQAHYDREGWDLYSINIENKTITRLTNTPGVNEHDPLIAYDVGRLFYISDANGIENIYEADLDGKNARPITNSLSRIVQISASRDGSKLAFCAVNKTGYNLYLLRDPLERKIDNLPLTGFFAQRNESKSTTDSVIARHSTEEQERNAQDTTKGYGGVGVDLSNYVYSDNPNTERSRQDMHTAAKIPVSTITNYRDSSGHYIVRDYKVIFSSDLITGTAGYAGYYGLQGSAQLLFSDELGNHQLYFATNLIIDLKNSDYLLAYYNLTDRTNYGLQGFHSARFLYTIPDPGYEQLVWFYSRFTTYGITGIASYPLDRFTRIDLNFSALVMEKDVIDNYYGAPLDLPTKRKYALNPSISYILDNTVWSYFYPKSGTRYNIAVGAAPAINPHFVGFVTPQFDIRHYISLPLGMSFAMRLSGATSFGPNPQKFYLGGLDGWINYYTSTVAYPITEPEDVSFNGEAYPLRGYAFNERVGTKYGLANLALRLPLPFFFAGAPLAIFGEVFSDAGSAWTNQVHLFQRLRNGEVMTKDLLWSNGVGFRTYFFGFYLKLDIAWRTNLVSTSHPQYLFSVGQDF